MFPRFPVVELVELEVVVVFVEVEVARRDDDYDGRDENNDGECDEQNYHESNVPGS